MQVLLLYTYQTTTYKTDACLLLLDKMFIILLPCYLIASEDWRERKQKVGRYKYEGFEFVHNFDNRRWYNGWFVSNEEIQPVN